MRKGQNQCAIAFVIGAKGRSWVFVQREHNFSPLGHPLGRQECCQVVRHRHREALIVCEFIPKLGRKN